MKLYILILTSYSLLWLIFYSSSYLSFIFYSLLNILSWLPIIYGCPQNSVYIIVIGWFTPMFFGHKGYLANYIAVLSKIAK